MFKTPITKELTDDQIANRTGGFGYILSPEKVLERFLILGTEGNTFYATEGEMTRENTKNVIQLLDSDKGLETVKTAVQISMSGRAVKNKPAIFVLALAASLGESSPTKEQIKVKREAYDSIRLVCRTGNDLFIFMNYLKYLKKLSGRAFRRGISKWYLEKKVENLALQVIKYRSKTFGTLKKKETWTHKDILRLARPYTTDDIRQNIFGWVVQNVNNEKKQYTLSEEEGSALGMLWAFDEIRKTNEKERIVELVTKYKLPEQAIPTEKRSNEVLECIIYNTKEGRSIVPMDWLLRNLGNFSTRGMLGTFSDLQKFIVSKFDEEEAIKRSRLHPLRIYIGMKTYAMGHGYKGSNTWDVNIAIKDALEGAFYKAFKYVEPTGKKFLYAIDVSGSMGMDWNLIGNIRPVEAAGVMCMASAHIEDNVFIVGFSENIKDLDISKNDRLDQVVKKLQDINFGATNIGAAIDYAIGNKIPVDCFIMFTDNEANRGRHPSEALREYMKRMGRESKLISAAFTATEYSVAPDNDPFALNVVGLDTNLPALISDFARNGFKD